MTILYEPKGRAREYAPLAVNLYSGCTHGCRYCYVPTIPPYKFKPDARAAFHACANPRRDVIRQLERDCRKRPGNGERVLFCFTTDPYQDANNEHDLTRQAIEVLHAAGYNVQVLTKGGKNALRDLEVFLPSDAFAATMTLLSPEHSRKWEPGAAVPEERMETLELFHAAGIPTWVSLEPVLNPDSALEIIRQTHSFVDLFKVGKLNHHKLAERFDWRAFGIAAVDLLESLSKSYYIKDDLRAFFEDVELGPHHVTVTDIEHAPLVKHEAQVMLPMMMPMPNLANSM